MYKTSSPMLLFAGLLLLSTGVHGHSNNIRRGLLVKSRTVCELETCTEHTCTYETHQYSRTAAHVGIKLMTNGQENFSGSCKDQCERICQTQHSSDSFTTDGDVCSCTLLKPLATAKNGGGNGAEQKCGSGYNLIKGTCVDIDECEERNNPCGMHSECTNTDGSYECTCLPGFEFNSSGWCGDVNECETDVDICGPDASCTNTVGSYECNCDDGYKGDPKHGKDCYLTCDAIWGNPCGPGVACIDTDSGYTCDEADEPDNLGNCPLGCPPSMKCGRKTDPVTGKVQDKCVCKEGYVEISPYLPCVAEGN